ncbi:MAG: hypothetical protein ABFD92_10905 [Planctomycetaceae bacterium]
MKLDLITLDDANGEIVLYLVEDGPWPDDEREVSACASRIQERIFGALDVAVDGHLAKKYPEMKSDRIRIQVDSPHGAPTWLSELIDQIGRCFEQNQECRDAIKNSPYVRALRIVTGHQMRRFKGI